MERKHLVGTQGALFSWVSVSYTHLDVYKRQAQRIAAESEFVAAEVYDLNHFPDLKDRYLSLIHI